MAGSGVLVHGVEGHATGLHGSCPGAQDVPWDIKSASLEKFVPPWTVRRLVWTDSLKRCHLGVSTDVLLFSDINKSLVNHYHVHKRRLPHLAFRKDYLTCPRVFVSQEAACLSVRWCPRFSPVKFQCAMLAPLNRNLSCRGRPDVPVAGYVPYEYSRSQSVSDLRL